MHPATPYGALLAAHAARRDPAAWPEGPVLVVVGPVQVTELALAAGLHPVQLTADPDAPTPTLDQLAGPVALGWRGRSLLEQVLALGDAPAAVLFTGTTAADAALYATVRELVRSTGVRLPPCAHLDAPGLDRDTSARYRRRRLTEAMAWLGSVSGQEVTPERLRAAAGVVASRDAVLSTLYADRSSADPRSGGTVAAVARQAGAALGPARHEQLLSALVAEEFRSAPAPALPGRRIVLSGSAQDETWLYEVLEQFGVVVLGAHEDGEVSGWSGIPDGRVPEELVPEELVAALADRPVRWPGRPAADDGELVEHLVSQARRLGATTIVHAAWTGDEVALWDAARLSATAPDDLEVVVVRGSAGAHRAEELAREWSRTGLRRRPVPVVATDRSLAPTAESGAGSGPVPRAPRSRKVLTVSDEFAAHQREWFAATTQRARDGEPFAVVSADYPHELLRAMDIPYVVTQWWSSIVGAKRLTASNAAALEAAGYPADVEPYSSQGLASHLAAEEPWGGLPRPDVLGAALGTAPTQRLYTAWARETGARYLPVERSAEARWELSPTWWEDLRHDWDRALEPARLELLQAELAGVVRGLEEQTGRRLDPDRLQEVLHLANEQAQANRQARDLVAAAYPAPAGVVDTMPATMVPQWHRGTVWARDAARALRDEIADRVAAGQGVVAEERLRLMWVGRGMWGDTALYQHLEDSHGAVFVWSMYLGLAADGYERQCAPGQDPLRALASRFATMGDELRMPTWAGAWHLKEARSHGVDAAVAIADADPFVVRTLEQAGIPVLRLPMDNTASDGGVQARRELERFVAGLRPGTRRPVGTALRP